MTWSDGLAPEIVYGLIPRCVGMLYVLAFGGMIFQHDHMPGSSLYTPGEALLVRFRRDFPGIRRFLEFPSIFWIVRSEAAFRYSSHVGLVLGLISIAGGPLAFWALLFAWILWVSQEARGAMYPWDTMLQEVGFLVLFMPATHVLPDLRAVALPLPSVAFMLRWFVARLMIGFGKEKFVGSRKQDRLYLRGFFVWTPLPTPFGWLAHHFPAWLLRSMLYVMFAAEIFAPVLGLFSGLPRLISYGMLVGLMIGIQATGNWGYFNVGYILLCTCLLDVHGSVFDLGRAPWVDTLAHWPDVAVHGLMGLMFVISLFYLPNNSFVTRTWLTWPVTMFGVPHEWMPLAKRLHRMLTPLRWISGLRIVNGFGVFPPHAMPPLRLLSVFEGSSDGVTWKQYGYKFMPSFPHSRPPVIAPYHARFDQYTYYVTLGIDTGSMFSSLYPAGHPYGEYTYSTVFDQVAQRLLEHDPRVQRLFGHNPFCEAPPNYVRVAVIGMTPTRISELRATGRWWHIRRFGMLLPARGKESWPDKLFLIEPEQFHPDLVDFRQRAKPLRDIVAAFRSGMPLDQAAIAGSDLTAADVEHFWNEVIPELQRARGDWSQIHVRREALLERHGMEGLFRIERVQERFVWLLRQQTQGYHLGERQPALPMMTNFRFHMFLQECVGDGREAYAALMAEPAGISERVKRTSDATQIWSVTLLRYERVMASVSTLRFLPLGLENNQGMPGLFEYSDLLMTVTPPGEEFCPQCVIHPDGEHTVEGFYPPPPIRIERPAAEGGMAEARRNPGIGHR